MAMHHDERSDNNAAYSKPILCKRRTKEKQRRNSFRLCLARMKKAEEPAPEEPKGPTQEELLAEIRDLLKAQK